MGCDKMKLKCNCCDGTYNSFDVHFTSACPFDCAHCIDKKYDGFGIVSPNIDAIVKTVTDNCEGVDDILFLGGEPCVYLENLIDCVRQIKEKTKLKTYVTTAVPEICFNEKEKFFELIELLDGINLSVQHYDERVADSIRRKHSQFDRQSFYDSLPNKSKIRINLNIVKPFLHTKEDITNCLKHYDKMGFNSIKLSEIQHGKEYFVSFEKLFGIHLPPPYSCGCQTYINMDKIITGFKTPLLLKRSCFLCEETLKASIQDGIKSICRVICRTNNKYGVIYEDGTLKKGWV